MSVDGFYRSGAIAAMALIAACLSTRAKAASYTWDSSGSGSVASMDGSGTWDTVSAHWWNSTAGTDQAWSNADLDTAVFGVGSPAANPYTVNLGTGITFGGITFQNQAYTIAGNTITLAGGSPSITTNACGGTIDSVLAGTSGLTTAGPGMLVLGGANTYTGGTNVAGGTLTFAGISPPGGIVNTAAGAVTALATGNFQVTSTSSVTYTGAGTVVKTGTSTYMATGAYNGNAYTTINMAPRGLLDIEGGSWSGTGLSNQIPSTNMGSLKIAAGATFYTDDGADQVATFDALSGGGTLSAPYLNTTLNLGIAGGSGTWAGVISGAEGGGQWSVNKQGAGIEVFTGNNTYAGTTTISGGTLQIGAGGAGGGISFGTIVNNAALVYNLVGQNTFPTIGSISGSGSVSATAASLLLFNSVTTGGSQYYNSTYSSLYGPGYEKGMQIGNGNVTLTTTGAGASITLIGDAGQANTLGNNLFLDTSAGNGNINLNISIGRDNVWFSLNSVTANAGTGTITISGNNAQNGWSVMNGTSLTGAIDVASNLTNGNSSLWTLDTTGPSTISGVLGGAAGLYKIGPAALTITSSSTYTGGTAIDGGTLQLGNGQSGQDGSINSTHVVSDNAVLAYNLYTPQTAVSAYAITGTGSVAQLGPGLLTLAASNGYSGGTTVSGGTLQLGNASALGSGTVAVSGGVLDLQGNSAATGAVTLAAGSIINSGLAASLNAPSYTLQGGTVSAVLNGGPLDKNTAGAVLLTASNTYAGGTTVNAGTLSLGAAASLGSGNLTVNPGGVLDVSAFGSSGYTFSGGALVAGRTASFASDINGTLNVQNAAVNVAGLGNAGTLTVNGGLRLTGGSLNYVAGDEIAVSGNLGLSGTDYVLPFSELAAGTYDLFTAGSITGGTANLAIGGQFGNSPRKSFAFNVSGGTAVMLTVSGSPANLRWSGGANSIWDNGASQNWYNLSTSAADYFYPADNVTFNDTPGTASNVTISGVVEPGSVIVSNTNVNYTFSGAGSIAGPTSLVKTGPGALTIANSNSYAGGTTLAGGVLNVNAPAALGSGTLTINGGTLDNTSGAAVTLAANSPQIWNANVAFRGTNPLNLGNGPVALGTSPVVTVGGTGALTVGGVISGAGQSLTVAGPGTLVLGGSNTYNGPTSVTGGTLVVENPSQALAGSYSTAPGSLLNFCYGNGTVSQSGSLTITGGGVFQKTGTGTWAMSNTTFNMSGGTIDVEQGTLADSNHTTSFANNNASLYVAAAATAVITGNDWFVDALGGSGNVELNFPESHSLNVGVNNGSGTFAGSIFEASGAEGFPLTLNKYGTGTEVLTGTSNYSGGTNVNAGTLVVQNTPVGSYNNNIYVAGGSTLQYNALTPVTQLDAAFGGSGVVQKAGPGILTFGGQDGSVEWELNSGALLDVEGGTLVGGSFATDNWNYNFSALKVAAGAVFNGVEANVNVDYLTGAGTIASGFNGAGYSSFSFGDANGSGTFSGVLTDAYAPANYVKEGSGSQVLTGSNTYTGATIIDGGTLQLGTGQAGLDGSIARTSGVSDLGALVFDLAGRQTAAYAIGGLGELVKTGGGALVLSGTNSFTGGTVVAAGTLVLENKEALADGSSLIVGNASYFMPPLTPAQASAQSTAVTPVPEPDTLALAAAGAAVAAAYIWRRKKALIRP